MVSLLLMVLASVSDIKTTEVPDRLSYGLIGFFLVLSLVHSVYSMDYSHAVETIVLGVAYLGVGLVFFYLGQWGGGDVKILSGVGCAMGYLDSIGYLWGNSLILPFYLAYFINMGLVAIPYLVVYTFVWGLREKSFFSEFLRQMRGRTFLILFSLSIVPSIISFYAGVNSLALTYLFIPAFTVLSAYLKVSESVLFRRKIGVNDLKAGDVLAEDLVVGGVKVISKSNMEGLTKEQLEKIKGLYAEGKIPGEVTVKFGVIFVPIYLTTFLLTLLVGNPLELALHRVL
ncbi:MAG: prepilin peptidase [Candidatus Altiarchaeota archaeon]|nr:prepilin peptidase [Candidatus Altiarchaeota archaeon]